MPSTKERPPRRPKIDPDDDKNPQDDSTCCICLNLSDPADAVEVVTDAFSVDKDLGMAGGALGAGAVTPYATTLLAQSWEISRFVDGNASFSPAVGGASFSPAYSPCYGSGSGSGSGFASGSYGSGFGDGSLSPVYSPTSPGVLFF